MLASPVPVIAGPDGLVQAPEAGGDAPAAASAGAPSDVAAQAD